MLFGVLVSASSAFADETAPQPPKVTAPTAVPTIETQPASPNPSQDTMLAVPDAGRFLPQPGLDAGEAEEVLQTLAAQAMATMGYLPANGDAPQLQAPVDTESLTLLHRNSPEGKRYLQLGYRTFRNQPLHIWLYAVVIGSDGTAVVNDDLAKVEPLIVQTQTAMAEAAKQMTVSDLTTRMVQLSYIEADRCLAVLKSLGYQTIEYTKAGESIGGHSIINPSATVDPSKLPIIIALPGPDGTGLVGKEAVAGAAFGLSLSPSVASQLPNNTSAAPLMNLLVMHDPNKPQQYVEVIERVRNHIDLPAQQIVIEAMVLEISETGLKKLGVEWELTSPFGHPLDNITELRLGRLPTFDESNNEESTFSVTVDDISNHWRAKLQALVRTGEAEILSRPSVLTLDNRQASIRVGEDVPVATSVA
ncbi:MAG: hypothetical protein MI741_22055, partial [Rhodospirillales bacterium]|nr:hypothetical protein [Rhodospirillales bacterium]